MGLPKKLSRCPDRAREAISASGGGIAVGSRCHASLGRSACNLRSQRHHSRTARHDDRGPCRCRWRRPRNSGQGLLPCSRTSENRRLDDSKRLNQSQQRLSIAARAPAGQNLAGTAHQHRHGRAVVPATHETRVTKRASGIGRSDWDCLSHERRSSVQATPA